MSTPAKLTGRVVIRDGGAVADAVVVATREQHGTVGWQGGAGTTDRTGAFALDVDPGTWTVQANVDTVRSERASVRVVGDATSSPDLAVDAR